MRVSQVWPRHTCVGKIIILGTYIRWRTTRVRTVQVGHSFLRVTWARLTRFCALNDLNNNVSRPTLRWWFIFQLFYANSVPHCYRWIPVSNNRRRAEKRRLRTTSRIPLQRWDSNWKWIVSKWARCASGAWPSCTACSRRRPRRC